MALTFAALERAPQAELMRLFRDGATPRPTELVGYEFRGLNRPLIAKLLGFQKFRKGFYVRPGEDPAGPRVRGYNVNVTQGGPRRPWTAKPNEAARKRHGFYDVYAATENPRFNEFPNALLIDYGVAENAALNPERVLRDYLVQPDPGNPDLYLGYAKLALGPVAVPVGFFLLERFAPVEYDGP